MATKKIKTPTKSDIIARYTDYCLMNGSRPATVYKFAKDNGFEEADFYAFFNSFETLEHHYFTEMFTYTLEMLQQSPNYAEYGGTQKLSAFYFTFFELATANRSFIMYLMDNDNSSLRSLLKMKELRKVFTAYAAEVLDKPFEMQNERADKAQSNALREAAWLQFLSVFKFWMKDTSPGFEKTDIFIEKSVKASSDLVYNTPLQSLFDLGKFLWKEKFTA
ncbi:TetR/AcrR family transcriptional regulator [Flavobacterium salilacus subsp. salilacus]|uniref:TetR family transcriptional regulator C-terminal domain-containing protein n=1 Tax=Flavobacterium TaxID=237 RepID=UPI001074E933|nr:MULTISPECIES: TetR family transcriptional regulator C-terminal domain-containing protein [Flavobacterium]KAF2519743.1 TetR/AcrR family transcriptional regulator [Flavobacterium salilacus subsp. salilacus]MBE1614367.1 TetR/AcrR family transcriptional regulator [Flavobacterium sp. SaA2.13]